MWLKRSVSAAASVRQRGSTRRRGPSGLRIHQRVAELPAASNPSRPCESWSADLAVETAQEGMESPQDLISRNKESVHQRTKGTCGAVNMRNFWI
jgi:hypothetical protein